MSLVEFALDPSDLTVPAQTPLLLTAVNDGSIDHDLTVEGVDGTDALAAGESAELALPAVEAGTYRMFCSITGHAESGMEATLTVTDEAAPAPDAEAGEADAGHSPEEMARLHEQGVADFPAETDGLGGVSLEPEVAGDGTKVFRLTADEVEWETEPGTVRRPWPTTGWSPVPGSTSTSATASGWS